MMIAKKLKKQDKTAVNNMRFFEHQPNQDGQILKAKKIKSRDETKLTERHHDPRMKCTVFFSSPEQKERYMERLNNPELLKKGGK